MPSDSKTSKQCKGGRPVGTTVKAKEERKSNIFKAKNDITKRFSAVKKICKNGKIRNGTLKKIIERVNQEFNLPNAKISPSAIRYRFYRKREIFHHVAGHVSPLQSIKLTIIAIVIHMARIRQSLCPYEGLRLVNSLIKNTNIQNEVVAWKEKYSNNNLPTVGLGYWSRFMKRNKDKIVSKRVQRYKLNRQKWITYANFVHIYSHCIEEMVDAGVAVLEEPVWMNREGVECDKSNAFGCKVTHKLI